MNELTKTNLYLSHMDSDELYHYGVLGMKWGVRRYQPYGQGYQSKNKGRTVGEASRYTSANAGRGTNGDPEVARKSRRKKLLLGAGIAAGVAALSVGAILGAKHIRKINAAKKYMANTDWSSTTMSMISDANSPIRGAGNRASAAREVLRNAPSVRSSGAPQLYSTKRNRYRAVARNPKSIGGVELRNVAGKKVRTHNTNTAAREALRNAPSVRPSGAPQLYSTRRNRYRFAR